MAGTSFVKSAVALVMMTVLGCDGERKPSTAPHGENKTREVSAVVTSLKESSSSEQKAALEMRDLLDSGEELAALRAARNLMDSKDVAIRSDVVDVFAWIGRNAMKELAEMANDSNVEIREAAIGGLERAIAEREGDAQKAQAVEEFAPKLQRQEQIEALMMSLSDVKEQVSLLMLARLIEKHPGTVVAEVAREYYAHYSGGEKFVSLHESEMLIKEMK